MGHMGCVGTLYMQNYTHEVLEVETTQESWKDCHKIAASVIGRRLGMLH